jgi:hypothetical protein
MNQEAKKSSSGQQRRQDPPCMGMAGQRTQWVAQASFILLRVALTGGSDHDFIDIYMGR